MAASLVAATFLVALLIWTPATVDAVREYNKKNTLENTSIFLNIKYHLGGIYFITISHLKFIQILKYALYHPKYIPR